MGLDDFIEAADEMSQSDDSSKSDNSSENKNSSGSGGLKTKSVSTSDYYRMERRYPYMSVESEHGELVRHIHPYTTPITFVKKDEDSDWERHETPDEIVEVWWDQMTLKNLAHKVRVHLDKDLYRLLREEPTEALSAINKAKHMAPKPQKPSQTRRCYICRKEHNRLSGDYQTINKKCVCNSHTIEEIKEADLL